MSVGVDGVGDSFYPKMGNGGYDVARYELDITVDVETNTIDATATIKAHAIADLARFNLDLHELDVDSITVDGSHAEFNRSNDELRVTPTTPLGEGDDFTVVIAYSGAPQPVEDPADPLETVGWFNEHDIVYVASEPSGAMSWFPSNNHPTDKATYEITITTTEALTAIANGVQASRVDNGDGTATTTWEMDDPMATYLASVYIGDFERRESLTDDGLTIRNYFPPEHADELEADFELTADAISFYEELLDAPYPFAEYGSIVVPFDLGFAAENQTISLHGLDTTDPDTIAHEIAHQWMGGSVTIDDWQDIWLKEGFATYLSYLYAEDRGLSMSLGLQDMYFELADGSVGPAEVPIDDLFGDSVYYRGALALHALRVEVGSEPFQSILRTNYARNAGGAVSTDEFRNIVGEIGGADAVDVLDAWLYGSDLPPFVE